MPSGLEGYRRASQGGSMQIVKLVSGGFHSQVKRSSYFAAGITLRSFIHSAVVFGKSLSFIMPLGVGVSPNQLVIILEGLEGSAGNGVS